MKIVKVISDAMMIPPWYGKSWYRAYSHEIVCLPIPLNILAAMARSLFIFFKCGHKSVCSNPRDAYWQGVNDGRKQKS